MNPTKMIRKCVEDFAPYVAGRPIDAVKKQYRLRRVVKLASNENPAGASPAAAKAVKTAAANIFRYPDSDSAELRDAVARHCRVISDNVVAGGGSDELIEIIAKTYFEQGDEIVVSAHAFIRYKMAGALMGAIVKEVPAKNLGHNLEAMARAVGKKTKAVFIANPNNPTGTYTRAEDLAKFFSRLRGKRLAPLVVLDEAYYEYAQKISDYPDAVKYLGKYPNLIILRTFSKIYGLAGLRLGYALCSTEIARGLNRIRPPFNVSSIAQAAGIAALKDRRHIEKSLSIFKAGRDYLYEELKKNGIPFVKTAGNFILIESGRLKGAEVFARLLKRGVIVRATDEYGLPRHFRATVGLPSENKIFIGELVKILRNNAQKKRGKK